MIVDALDEGRLLSSETGIEQFLISTAELLRSNRTVTSRPKLIFLGRFDRPNWRGNRSNSTRQE